MAKFMPKRCRLKFAKPNQFILNRIAEREHKEWQAKWKKVGPYLSERKEPEAAARLIQNFLNGKGV